MFRKYYIKILVIITSILCIHTLDYETNETDYESSGDYDSPDDDNNTRCSVDSLMDTLTPSDYDDHQNISRSKIVPTFNETIARVMRLNDVLAKVIKEFQQPI